MMPLEPIKTPCTGICTIDHTSGYCIGCGRTGGEIMRWMGMSDGERDAVMLQCENRMQGFFEIYKVRED